MKQSESQKMKTVRSRFGANFKRGMVSLLLVLPMLTSPFGLSAQGQTQKINKKNLVIKEWNAAAGSSHKVLDHKTIYNAEGKKIDEIEYTSSRVKWTKKYEYGADAKPSRELLYNERGKLQTIKKFEYNEFGRKKVQYTYDAKGKLLTVKTFEYEAEDPQ